MLTSQYWVEDGKLVVSGYLKGESLSTSWLIHVTGCGNFMCEKIFVKNESWKKDEIMESEVLVQEENKDCDGYEIENEVDPFGAE